MADLKISELPTASALTGTEQIPVTQGGQTRRAPASAFAGQVHTHTLSQITDAGTAAALDVPASPGGTATSTQVVRGDDPRLSGGGGSGGAVFTDRGNVTGAVAVDMGGGADVVQALRLIGNTTITITNLPLGYAELMLMVRQDGTGGRTLTLPGNSVLMNGSNGSIAPAANARSVITLITRDGGSNWDISISDQRPSALDPIIINPQDNASYEFVWDAPITLELAQVVERGTGSAAYTRRLSAGGSFSSVSGTVNLAAGDVFRVTVSGRSGWYTLAIPRSA